MLRLILWILIFLVVWRVIARVSAAALRHTSSGHRTAPPRGRKRDFSDIPDAEFEDLTPHHSSKPRTPG